MFRLVFTFFISALIVLSAFIVTIVYYYESIPVKIQRKTYFMVNGNLVIFFASILIMNCLIQVYMNTISVFYLIYRLDTKIAKCLGINEKIIWYKQKTLAYK